MPAQPEPTDRANARKLATAVEEALAKEMRTFRRDPMPLHVVVDTSPVVQPGRPPMSQAAVNASTLMLSAGVASLPFGAIGIGVMLASDHANPTVIGMICAAPAALAVPILALSLLVKRAKQAAEAAPPTVHQHFNGPVHQDQRSTSHRSKGVWVKNNYKGGSGG